MTVEPAPLGCVPAAAQLTAEQMAAEPLAVPQTDPCGPRAPDPAVLVPAVLHQAPPVAPSVPAGRLFTVPSRGSGNLQMQCESEPVAAPPEIANLPVRSGAPRSPCALEPLPVEELATVEPVAASLPAGSAFATPNAVGLPTAVVIGHAPDYQP